MSSLFSLEGKVAIVTGPSKWTGRAIALEMAKAGADIVGASRKVEPLEAVVAEIRSLGRRCIGVPTDVREGEQVGNMVKKALEEFGRIDILVNSAGSDFIAPALETTEEAWDRSLRLNLRTFFLCCKAVAGPMIEKGGGSIVNITSAAGLSASPTNPAYGAAKAGVMSLTKTLAVEWGRHNIRVNAVAPGFIDTPMHPGYLDNFPHLKEIYERVPLGRGVTMEEVAAAVIYLASDAAGCTSGVIIPLEGGMTSRMG